MVPGGDCDLLVPLLVDRHGVLQENGVESEYLDAREMRVRQALQGNQHTKGNVAEQMLESFDGLNSP